MDFMLYIFDRYTNCINEENETDQGSMSSGNDQTLFNIEKGLEKTSTVINLRIIFSTLLTELLDTIDPQQILAKHERVLDFCSRVLKTIAEEESSSDLQPRVDDNATTLESIHLTLSLISVFTTGLVDLSADLKERLRLFMPILERLKNDYKDNEVAEMAESLFISIGTNCAIKSEPIKSRSKANNKLIEEIQQGSMDDYDKALNDVKDPLIPVKAHGLVSLRKMIDSRNEKCLTNQNELIDLFMKYLKHDDSYVYLASINCLIR